MKVHLSLDKRTRRNGNYAILVEVTTKNLRVRPSTGIYIPAEWWDAEEQCLKERSALHKKYSGDKDIKAAFLSINSIIHNIKGELSTMESIMPEEELTKEYIKTRISELCHITKNKAKRDKPKKSVPISVLFAQYREGQGRLKTWSNATYKKYKTLERHLLACNPHLTYKKINNRFIENLSIYFEKKRGFKDNYTARMSRNLKTFLTWCEKKEYIPEKLNLNISSTRIRSARTKSLSCGLTN